MRHFAGGFLWTVLLAMVTLGCQSVGMLPAGESKGIGEGGRLQADAYSVGPVLSTDEMRRDAFTLHQQLRFSYAERSGKLESVIQKNCDSLDVVGLGPLNIRIFTLRQIGRGIDYEPENLDDWPVSPLQILNDIHRIYFYPLMTPAIQDSVQETQVGDVYVSEMWRSGRLRQRILSRPEGQGAMRIRIDYLDGLVRDEAPGVVTLVDELREYRLEVETVSFSLGECKK